MKKRFLPFSLLLVIMILGQAVMADQGGHYVPREKANSSADAFISSMRVNQHTGMIDPAWMIAANKQVEGSSKSDVVYWLSMGPDNMGGRTTSIVYNNANRNEVYIGSMGGGVFYTWNQGISWHQVGENLMVSCMAQADDGTIYVGTGDCGVAYDYNGFANIGYGNSFIGSGLYTIKDNVMTLVEGTAPTDNNDPEGEWSFINDLAIDGETVIAATSDGLRYLQNGTWHYAKSNGANITGSAIEVKVGSNHTVVASVDGKIYIGSLNDMACKSAEGTADVEGDTAIDSIGTPTGLLDVAIAPNDDNMIYAASINNNGNHVKFYLSEDRGNTWRVILPTVGNNMGHQVYEGRGLYNHGLVVDPEDSGRLFVQGFNLWMLEKPTSHEGGYYMALQLSNANMLHTGINAIAFDPRTEKKLAYVGTDGGIYKASKLENSYFSFVNCNRGYISTRCLAVAPSGKNTRIIGGVLDQGPVLIEGQEGLNNMETGELLLPSLTGAHYGAFDESYNAGPCAVSLIQPKAFIISTVDGGLQRSEDGGLNYDFANFTSNLSLSYTGYRLPIAYWESFNDENSTDEIWFWCKQDQSAGDVVQVFSDNGGYPFNYVLPIDMHYDSVSPLHSDSLLVKDIITTKMAVPSTNGNNTEVYYTLDALKFSKITDWFKIATVAGYTTCMTFSADGNNLFIGTKSNGLYRISNLRHAVDANTADPGSADFAPVLTTVELPTTDQCVTSISVYSEDANKIVVTLGNYGNDNYILYSSNALSDTPTFAEKQGNLPKMPVYSSVYTSTYDGANQGHVLIGTEHGVYRTTNIGSSSPVWTLESDNMGDVPVLDLKQQLVRQEDQFVTTIIDDVPTVTTFAGTNNQGVIYAATYGRGLFRCETYRQNSGTSVPETPAAAAQSKVNMYPNPVRDEAMVSFEIDDNANVTYQVYDMSGRMLKVESLGSFSKGKYEVNVNLSELAKGAYVLRLNAGSQTSSVKFMVF